MVRDEKGRFGKDNGGGPGRPRKTEEQEVKRLFKRHIPPDLLFNKLLEAIDQGKEWAIKLAFYYEFDMPMQSVKNEVTGADGGDFVIRVRLPDGK